MSAARLGVALAAALSALVSPAAHAQATKAAGIPLCPGLQVVTAISQKDGDYESIKTIQSVNDQGVRLKYSSEKRESDPLAQDYGVMKKSTIFRSIRKADLANSTFYAQRYFDGMPETIPESTAIGVSAKVLRELKSGAAAEFGFSNAYDKEPPVDRNVRPNIYDFIASGELKRVQAGSARVLVNNVLIDLPTVKATGDFFGEPAEFVILDDINNPLVLSFRIGIGMVINPSGPTDTETLKVVKITHRCEAAPPPAPKAGGGAPAAGAAPAPGALPQGPSSQLAADLAKSGKVAIYDIYFDFNEARIREESEPRLKEIADVMKANPSWRLSVAGHTDSVASDSFNLDLSKRRAAAVKSALVSRYSIAADRLDTTGNGEAQPRDTNDTVEGRARNRRVELQKL